MNKERISKILEGIGLIGMIAAIGWLMIGTFSSMFDVPNNYKTVPRDGYAVVVKTQDGQVVNELWGDIQVRQNGGDGDWYGLFNAGSVDWTSTGFTIKDVTKGHKNTTYTYGATNSLEYTPLTKEEANEHNIPKLTEKVVDKEKNKEEDRQNEKKFKQRFITAVVGMILAAILVGISWRIIP